MSQISIQHHWEENKDDSQDEKKNSNDNCCIAVFGTSKVGKSSLIRLFCGDVVKTSDSIASCTKGSTVFPDLGHKTQRWMDTQGTDDTEMKDDDEKVLKKSFKALYESNTSNIKLIWIISGDMDGERGEFQKQAKFISSFVTDNYNKYKVWESCLIIHKKGMLRPDLDSIKGAIAAAKHFSSRVNYSSNQHLVGYTCIDWLKKNDSKLEIIKMLPKEQQLPMLSKNGYFTANKIKQIVSDKLSKLPSLKLEFLNEKCSKCGIKGDHRFIKAKCHTNPKYIHTKQLENFHDGSLQWKHTLGTYEESSVSTTTSYYHSGSYKRTNLGGQITGSIITFGLINTYTDESDWCSWTCCNRCRRDATGCQSTTNNYTSYTTKYRCCSGSLGSSPCTQVYTCCGEKYGKVGCKQRYRCCTKIIGSYGCTKVCEICQVDWGKEPGCQSTSFMKE